MEAGPMRGRILNLLKNLDVWKLWNILVYDRGKVYSVRCRTVALVDFREALRKI